MWASPYRGHLHTDTKNCSFHPTPLVPTRDRHLRPGHLFHRWPFACTLQLHKQQPQKRPVQKSTAKPQERGIYRRHIAVVKDLSSKVGRAAVRDSSLALHTFWKLKIALFCLQFCSPDSLNKFFEYFPFCRTEQARYFTKFNKIAADTKQTRRGPFSTRLCKFLFSDETPALARHVLYLTTKNITDKDYILSIVTRAGFIATLLLMR